MSRLCLENKIYTTATWIGTLSHPETDLRRHKRSPSSPLKGEDEVVSFEQLLCALEPTEVHCWVWQFSFYTECSLNTTNICFSGPPFS